MGLLLCCFWDCVVVVLIFICLVRLGKERRNKYDGRDRLMQERGVAVTRGLRVVDIAVLVRLVHREAVHQANGLRVVDGRHVVVHLHERRKRPFDQALVALLHRQLQDGPTLVVQ